ncbi:hypothetical protein Hypma_014171 [Hypsizygus marmoreus]|uniref:Tc1-like transposase DDE domain-containing protein n=1 Tax=Hypsizygus marmoreus TaxID=39966 RepID=A0A369KG36_HYPMA|nr:hypothetical protein Hypma_014171 [Hypsizygus marmoreus]
MDIIDENFSQDFHCLVYDNAPTHLKRTPTAPSAKKMTKNTPPVGKNWLVEVNMYDENGKQIYNSDGSYKKQHVQMSSSGFTEDGTPQSFYFEPGHEREGVFKGMAIILEERGFKGCVGRNGRLAECGDFSQGCVTAGQPDCCCRRMLYNEPDFVNVWPRLEEVANARGFAVLFLPKFHCELNFIEQCWGYAKRVYRTFPLTKKEDEMEKNIITALDSVPLETMRRCDVLDSRFRSL